MLKNKYLIYLVVFGLVVNLFSATTLNVSANVFFGDENVFLHCDDNEVYNVSSSLQEFNHVVVDGDFVQFNDTAFRCDFDTNVNVTILYLNVMNPYGNLTVLSFSYEQGEGVSYHNFNISGFLSSQSYYVYTNNTFLVENISDDNGWVNFTSDILWGRVDVVLFAMIIFGQLDGEGGGSDPLYDEVPRNNSYVWFDDGGFNTTINIDYTAFPTAVRYENYTTGNDGGRELSTIWVGQTFNMTEDIYIGRIGLMLHWTDRDWFIGYDDYLEIYIMLTTDDESDAPNGTHNNNFEHISEGFFPYENLTETPTWYTVSMSSALLQADTSYAIAVQHIGGAPDVDHSNWSWDASSPTYNKGAAWWYEYAVEWIWYPFEPDTDFMFEVYGVPADNISVTNLTFDWYNDSLGDWEQYGFVSVCLNSTYTFWNTNFSGIGVTYVWRVHAIANDTGVSHEEIYRFTTFVLAAQIEGANTAVLLSFSLFFFPFWLIWKRRRKNEKQNI